ncbi:interferon-gamma-inducible GTPase 10-like [Heteronotia binoei]|uniref:interferon-gamma-inducible GTPase 10-like n=1 Tax=Heteronotia binoei TaxID=13085 RepID=UPI00292D55AF|nr:interferon-gamma-inducible GTPase 10-like [Heteronotia binoei]
MEPMCYPHPTFPDVRIWDLPGIGTPGFEEKEYLERIKDSQYDFFILVACHCFTTYDIQLSHTIREMGKRFYYVWSKMDVSIRNEKRKPDFSEEVTLQKARKYCLYHLKRAGISSPVIFLISIWYQDKYDFPLLKRALENEINELRKCILRTAVLQDSEKRSHDRSRRHIDGKSLMPVASRKPEERSTGKERNLSDLTASRKNTLDIAITGLTGAGKSSLVNALRGLSDFDEEAAKTDVIEGTKEPMGYSHPAFPDVTIWDLPGIGTPSFKAEEYLERVNYSQYDFFIIVSSNRFTVYDIQLSHAIRKMTKRFYYVRSKMDLSIENEKLKPDFNEETTLQKVRK